ncbi:aromatic ring-cleaving dioxygenase [Xenococcus sp. PCC 7305]|uniref:DOPA 4,5-dioxygenase family protein n=1 Tax=Xenococcus sp. PCC 7305 TaxID=102125 RepID=UPI0002ACD9F3|nr:DOPA 4,5-dioxygenase family protein [Xenococcus sp. PCC 7305]ELS05139.1 aromatic ring-cleaving dioxygenase [Xenococcus sp. PCC 7305]
MNFQDISLIKGYHAHVYFEESTFELAQTLCEEAGKRFGVTVGRMHRKPVGPHPCWSCQLAFDRGEYAELLSWLALNRNGLTILIHTLTGDDLLDHTDYASWMGEPQALNLDVLRAAS